MAARMYNLAVQDRREILPLHRSGWLDAEHAENRWRNVVGGGVEVARLSGPLAFRMPDHEHRIGKLRVQSVAELAGVAVFAEEATVIADDDEKRVVHEAEIVGFLHELPEPVIHLETSAA